MRAQIQIPCEFCKNVYSKDKAEYRRQLKKGHQNFFCTDKCNADFRKIYTVQNTGSFNCAFCFCKFDRNKTQQIHRSSKSKTANLFCTKQCSIDFIALDKIIKANPGSVKVVENCENYIKFVCSLCAKEHLILLKTFQNTHELRKRNRFYCDSNCQKLFINNLKKSKKHTYRGKSKYNICKLVNSAYKRSLKYNRVFSIVNKDIDDLWESQQGKCAISGIQMVLPKNKGQKNPWSTNSVSLDRIDSSKGYEKGNIQLVTIQVNIGKNNLSDAEFLRFCYLVNNKDNIDSKIDLSNKQITSFARKAIRTAKQSSKYKQIEFELDEQFIKELWISQNGICLVSGLVLGLLDSDKSYCASLDRIDSSGGYTKTNVRLVTRTVNYMKNQFDDQSVFDTCRAVCEFNNL